MKKFNLSEGKLWPAFTRPRKDELFSSWLIRNAHNHFISFRKFYRYQIPSIFLLNKDIDRTNDPQILKFIANKTNTSITKINKTLFSNKELFFSLIPFSYYSTRQKRSGIMFCPKCFTDDKEFPYLRRSWRLSTSFVCLKHGSFLLDRCPECFSPIMPDKIKISVQDNMSPNLKIAYCSNCSFFLGDAKTKKVSFELIQLQKKLIIKNQNLDLLFKKISKIQMNLLSKNKAKKANSFRMNAFNKLGCTQRVKIILELNRIKPIVRKQNYFDTW